MNYKSQGFTKECQVKRILNAGVPLFSACGFHIYDPEDPTDADVGPYPVWTFEGLMNICRKAQIKAEFKDMGCDDFIIAFFAYIICREDDLSDRDQWRTYLDQLVSFIDNHSHMFQFGTLTYYDVFFHKRSARAAARIAKAREWVEKNITLDPQHQSAVLR